MNTLPKNVKDLSGKRFGILSVLYFERTERKPSHRGAIWKCLCDCGNIKEICSRALLGGQNKSCGCMRTEYSSVSQQHPPKDLVINRVYNGYVVSSRKRGLEFSISRDDIKALIFENCFYCGSEPSSEWKLKRKYGETKSIKYNGIDRVDNEKGYVDGNVVSCCHKCNMSKRSMGLDEWKQWIIRVYENYGRKQK